MRQTDGEMDVQKDDQTDRRTDGQTDRKRERQTQTDSQRQTDEQNVSKKRKKDRKSDRGFGFESFLGKKKQKRFGENVKYTFVVNCNWEAGDSLLLETIHVCFNRLFSASMTCRPQYKVTEHIKCSFNLKNNDRYLAYSVLMSTTPLREESPLGLQVFRDGTKLEFRGILEKREYPKLHDFLFIDKGQNVSRAIDLSSSYDTSKPGMYTVAVNTYLQYVQGSVQPSAGNSEIQTELVHLSSSPTKFQVRL